MAIFNLTASVGSRAGGASAGSKFDYLSREGRYHHDAAEVRDVESGNMPDWASADPRAYWAAADAHERANGQLFRQVHVALPVELSRDQQTVLARQFSQDVTGRERLPYTLAIHEGKSREPGKPPNPHAHLIWSDRGHDGIERTAATWFKRYNGKAPEKGGARKSREGRGPEWLVGVREQWATRVNVALKRDGHEARVDHRSLAVRSQEALDRGDVMKAAELAREPNVHLGPAAAMAVDRMHEGKPLPERVEEALRVEERNGRWDRLKAEIRRLGETLKELTEHRRRLTEYLRVATVEMQQARQRQQRRMIERDIGFSR